MDYFKYRKIKNWLFYASLYTSAALVLLPLFLIVSFVFNKGAGSLNLNFFLNAEVGAGDSGGGMAHAILGTLTIVALGGAYSIPIGVLCGIFLAEFPHGKVASALRIATDLLTGIPSIVVGIFAYLLVVIPMQGFSALAGSMGLAIIILPIVIRSTEEILKLVPDHIREAGLALGLPRWKVIYFIIVKGNLSGITTGVMLAISRAAGETAPLLFTAFGARFISFEIDKPMASLPVQIYTYASSPLPDLQRQAWAGAFVLITLVLGLNILSRAILNRKQLLEKVSKK